MGGATAYSVVTEVVSITVRPVSDAPTLSDIPDQRTMMGRPWGPLDFTIGDVDTPVANLSLSAASSNAELVPVGNIGLGGSGISRTVTVTPTAGLLGSATVAITVDDGSTAISDAYVLTVWARAYLPLVVRQFRQHQGDLVARFGQVPPPCESSPGSGPDWSRGISWCGSRPTTLQDRATRPHYRRRPNRPTGRWPYFSLESMRPLREPAEDDLALPRPLRLAPIR